MTRFIAVSGLVLYLLLLPAQVYAETVDVYIKGVDDGRRTNKQQDHKEAVMNAKLQAIERAGVEIQSITKVVNFQTQFDMVESKASAILLPGFQVLDIGYLRDGTYQVVLIGKVKSTREGAESKELRYAQSLVRRGRRLEARKVINDIISNSKDDNVVAEAMYYQVLWKFAFDEMDTYEKLKAYYPNSKYVAQLKTLLAEREAERKRLEIEKQEKERLLAAIREAERKRQKEKEAAERERLLQMWKEEEIRLAAEREAERKRVQEQREYARQQRESRLAAERKTRLARIGKSVYSDGFYISGDKGIVLDTRTLLEWVVGPHRDMSWYEARDWARSLTISGGGWRMPTEKELETIYQKHDRVSCKHSLLYTNADNIWTSDLKIYSSEAKAATFGVFYCQYHKFTTGFATPERTYEMRAFAVRSIKSYDPLIFWAD